MRIKPLVWLLAFVRSETYIGKSYKDYGRFDITVTSEKVGNVLRNLEGNFSQCFEKQAISRIRIRYPYTYSYAITADKLRQAKTKNDYGLLFRMFVYVLINETVLNKLQKRQKLRNIIQDLKNA